jgi:hypothetical protein
MHEDAAKALEMAGWRPGRVVKLNQSARGHVVKKDSQGLNRFCEIPLRKKDCLMYCGTTNIDEEYGSVYNKSFRDGFVMTFLPLGRLLVHMHKKNGTEFMDKIYYVPSVKYTTAYKVIAYADHNLDSRTTWPRPAMVHPDDLAYSYRYFFGNVPGKGGPAPSVETLTKLNTFFVKQKLPCVFNDVTAKPVSYNFY